jgi:hypothetical protein
MGMQVATATGRYGDENGGQSLKLEITDMGGAKGVLALANHATLEEDRQTDSGYVKTYHQGGNMIHERLYSASYEG